MAEKKLEGAGLRGQVAGQTALSTVGKEGKGLTYRGYAIEELSEKLNLSTSTIKKRLRAGQRAKERMVAANLRLVVSVAKKYTKRNLSLIHI